MNIRTLRADEIECRVQSVKGSGCILLLYKDARADMKILDEVFGIDGWEREHQLIDGKLFCTVRIWSDKRNCWISKQDVGTESNTEKEKGQASDSFKRACFNIGIGRELYSSPFVWINLENAEISNGRLDSKVKFSVKEIIINESREISKLVIEDNNGKERFSYPKGKSYSKKQNKVEAEKKNTDTVKEKVSNLISEPQLNRLYMLAKGIDPNTVKNILSNHKFSSSKEITKDKYNAICKEIEELNVKA